jgi:hypothetical protein
MSTKKKPARNPAPKPAALSADKAVPTYDLRGVIEEMQQIVALLGKLTERFTPTPTGQTSPLPPPSDFVSGGFHRRSGDIYQNVAHPGSPNAETPAEPVPMVEKEPGK